MKLVYLTLHVGLGTFRPVSVDNVDEHEMHSEFYNLSAEAAQTLNQVKDSGSRIVAVGTTSIRTLETIGNKFDGVWKLILVGQISSSNLATTSESLMPSQPISTCQNLLWLC